MPTVFNLADHQSIANQFLAELRDTHIQQDRMRFRRNLERIGEVLAYEISKTLHYTLRQVETPLGIANMWLPDQQVVIGTILRAGLPMHQGMLNLFDRADNAFISAYRRHLPDGSFDIQLDYVSTPDLDGTVLILADPMLATGASVNLALEHLGRYGTPAAVHVATVIASTVGLAAVQKAHPNASVWMAGLDDELTAKSYIVPGLGDAGDLAFGEKQ
jgi:uracil phosphoribosyltransferase